MKKPVVWQPLRDVIAEAIYMDPRDFPENGENWPTRLDFPRWEDLPEEKRENWRQDADRVLAILASCVGCTPRMEQAIKDKGDVFWLSSRPAQVFAEMIRAEIEAHRHQ